jgi:O-antigen ligase
VEPLRLLWVLTALTAAVIVAYWHAFPQAPYPSRGIAPALGLVVLAAASVLIVARAPWLRPLTVAPVLLPCLLLLWAWRRTSVGLVPSEGTPLLGTLLEGLLIFTIVLILAAVGGQWDSFRLRSATAADHGSPGRTETNGPTRQGRSLFLSGALLFFLILALGLALWAIYQYFVLYDQQLVEFRLRYGAQGLAALSPEQWAVFEALRAKRVGSRFGNPNVLAGFLSMAAPLAVAAALTWTDRSARAIALGILGLIGYVVLLTGSRGGMLTLLFATLASAAILGRPTIRKHRVVLAIAAGVCMVAVALAILSERRTPPPTETPNSEPLPRARYSFFERLRTSPTIAQRLYYLQSGWEMIRRSPWWGHGLGSYAILYPKYKQPLAREARYPHNILCHLWVETGLAGLFLWVAWVVVVLARALVRCRRDLSGEQALIVRMLAVAATVFLFNNLFEMTWAFRESYLDWCVLLGFLAGFGPRQTAASERPDPESVFGSRTRLAQAMAAAPLVEGIVFAYSLLLAPMTAQSCEIEANDLLTYGKGKEIAAEAFRLAQRMIAYQPRNPQYHHWLACFDRDMGRPAEAAREFEEALRLNPYSAKMRSDYAAFKQTNGETSEARRLLREAIELYPLNPSYHYQLAELERRAGRRDAAREEIQEALRCALDARQKPVFEQFLRDLDAATTATR